MRKVDYGWDASFELEPKELLDHGILWYINRVAFHPRGMGLGFDPETGKFVLHADFKETIAYSDKIEDEKYAAFNKLLDQLHDEPV